MREMPTNRKLSTGGVGLDEKIRVIPAGNDMVRSPVIFTRHLRGVATHTHIHKTNT